MSNSFYVYPDPDDRYWKVKVQLVRDTACVTHTYNSLNPKNTDEIGGLFRSMRVWTFKTKKQAKTLKGGKPTGEFGQITLPLKGLTAHSVVHECGHAAHEYCRRRRRSNFKASSRTAKVAENEETYCYALGHMSDQIMTKLLKRGLRFSVTK